MRLFTIVIVLMVLSLPARAQDAACKADDKACLLTQLESLAGAIPEDDWRDQIYRELAKLLVHEMQSGKAIGLVEKIKNPDKQAMTIRAIGIEAADLKLPREEYNALFTQLTAEAHKIAHPPSHAIALNYIADAQALSGDDDSALKTAMTIENSQMRNKALYDSSKIQAERGDLEHARASITAIDSPAFRNKARTAVSQIFANSKKYDESLKAAMDIDNPYLKAQAVLYLVAKQISPEEVSLVE